MVLKGIFGIALGLIALLIIYYYTAPTSILTVGGVILTVLALAIGIPAALVFFKIISSAK